MRFDTTKQAWGHRRGHGTAYGYAWRYALWGLGMWGLVVATLCAPALPAQAQIIHRSLDEFIAAQGTFCVPDGSGGCLLLTPPVPNYIGWRQPDPLRLAFVDYAGLADRWIQTESGGP